MPTGRSSSWACRTGCRTTTPARSRSTTRARWSGTRRLFRLEEDGYYHEYNDPFVWTEAEGFTRLPHIGDDRHNTEPFAINNDGYVVGQSHIGNEQHAVMWSPDGTIEDLGNLPGQSGGWARAINDSGVVVGSSGDDAFTWTRADGMRRLPDFGFDGAAVKVTSDGWVLGSAQITPWDETPVVWDPQGRVYDVYGMVEPAVVLPRPGDGPERPAPAAGLRLHR